MISARCLILAALNCGTGAENEPPTGRRRPPKCAAPRPRGTHRSSVGRGARQRRRAAAGVARRLDGRSQEAVLQLAVHLGTIEQARRVHVVECRRIPRPARGGQVTPALRDLVRTALGNPDLVAHEVGPNEVERRRAEASLLATSATVVERIHSAPRAYVLAHTPADLARHALLCEPPPGRDELRVLIESDDDGSIRVEIAARDRIGLLARTARVLLDLGCSIDQSIGDDVARPGGVGLVPRAGGSPTRSRDGPPHDFAELLGEPLIASPVPNIELVFDNADSPWYTLCTATGPDRPGLLHALTATFAAGLSVHSARITTDGTQAVDHFELTDKNGAKLDEAAKARLREVVAQGIRARGRRVTSPG